MPTKGKKPKKKNRIVALLSSKSRSKKTFIGSVEQRKRAFKICATKYAVAGRYHNIPTNLDWVVPHE